MSIVIELPPGTYDLTGDITGTRDVLTLTVVADQAGPAVGSTITFTTNATAGASFVVRKNGTDTATTGVVGTDDVEYDSTGDTAGDDIVCRVASGTQQVDSVAVELVAPASLSLLSTQFIASSAGGPTVDFAIDTSDLTTGDRVIFGYTNNAGDVVPADFTVGGVSVGASAAVLGTAASWRRVFVWEYTMPAPAATTTFVLDNTPSQPNGHRFTAFGVRGGALNAGASAGAADTALGAAATINPPSSPNLILAVSHRAEAQTAHNWMNATDIPTGSQFGFAASVTDATALTNRTVTSTGNVNGNNVTALILMEPV